MWVRARARGVVLQRNVVKTGAQARGRARTKRYGYERMDADRRTEGGGRRRGYASMRVRDGDEPVDVGRHTPRGGGAGTRKYVCARVRVRGYGGGRVRMRGTCVRVHGGREQGHSRTRGRAHGQVDADRLTWQRGRSAG